MQSVFGYLFACKTALGWRPKGALLAGELWYLKQVELNKQFCFHAAATFWLLVEALEKEFLRECLTHDSPSLSDHTERHFGTSF